MAVLDCGARHRPSLAALASLMPCCLITVQTDKKFEPPCSQGCPSPHHFPISSPQFFAFLLAIISPSTTINTIATFIVDCITSKPEFRATDKHPTFSTTFTCTPKAQRDTPSCRSLPPRPSIQNPSPRVTPVNSSLCQSKISRPTVRSPAMPSPTILSHLGKR